MNVPLYTAVAAAVLLLLQLGLMMAVGFARLALQQGIGDGGNNDLLLKIRRHGNLAENAPIFLAVLLLLELLIGSTTVVAALAAAFVLVRVSHAIGLSLGDGPNLPRAVGAFGTLLVGVGTAGYLLLVAIPQL